MKTRTLATLSVLIFSAALILTSCSKNETSQTKVQETKQESKTASNQNNTSSKTIASGTKVPVVSEASSIIWEGGKVTGKHHGTVKISEGNLYLAGQNVSGGEFDIDFSTIKVDDIKDPEMNGKLEKHLKSDDFFSAEAHPKGKFVITSVENISDPGGNNILIHGELTIKGITNKVSFPAKATVKDGKISASAEFKIDRTLWDIKFRSGKFFENLGDNLIYDDFTIKLDIKAEA